MKSRADIQELIDNYLAALNHRDADRVVALFAEDAEQQEPVGSAPNKGHRELHGFFTASLQVPFTLTRFGPACVIGNRAVFSVLVEIETDAETHRMVTTDVITVNEEGLIQEILAFPDQQANPADAPGARKTIGEGV